MKTIKFKIISNENKKIYQEGYVEVPEAVEEMPEWFYYDQNGFDVPRAFTHHDGIGLTQIGATDEQKSEIEKFNEIVFVDEIDFINDTILTAEETENRTYVRNDITIIVNDGAKMECEIEEPANFRGDYIVELTPKFNGKNIYIAQYMQDTNETFDPYGGCDEYFTMENGKIYFEISKDYFEGDEEDKEYNIKIINDEARRIYAKKLTYVNGYSNYHKLVMIVYINF